MRRVKVTMMMTVTEEWDNDMLKDDLTAVILDSLETNEKLDHIKVENEEILDATA